MTSTRKGKGDEKRDSEASKAKQKQRAESSSGISKVGATVNVKSASEESLDKSVSSGRAQSAHKKRRTVPLLVINDDTNSAAGGEATLFGREDSTVSVFGELSREPTAVSFNTSAKNNSNAMLTEISE